MMTSKTYRNVEDGEIEDKFFLKNFVTPSKKKNVRQLNF